MADLFNLPISCLWLASIFFNNFCYYKFCILFLEKISFVRNFALQISTKFIGRTHSLFIPVENIHDIVIKETIQKVKKKNNLKKNNKILMILVESYFYDCGFDKGQIV